MNTRLFAGVLIAVSTFGVPAFSQDVINITADVTEQRVEGEFQTGDIVPITFYVSSEGEVGLFGVEFGVAAATEDVRIASVSINPVFSRVFDRSGPPLPGSRFRAICLQARDTVDESLGSTGQEIPLATVEIEILSDTRFRSALRVRARGALIGGEDAVTTLMGTPQTGQRPARGRIRIVSSHPEPPADPVGEINLLVKPFGAGEAVSVLEPDTPYRLFYAVDSPRVNNFVLFMVGTTPDDGFDVAAPTSGRWSSSDGFELIDLEETARGPVRDGSYPEGYYRYVMATNELFEEDGDFAGRVGRLCDFVTGAPGEFNLHLYIWWDDPTGEEITQMETRATFPVE